MNVGITYYPEYYGKSRWRGHFAKIRDAGLRRIRMAEFAWSLIQPNKDVFSWQVIDDAIDVASDFGIEVVLGTPTACPPIWLVSRHPEVLPVGIDGHRTGFGARQHRCYNSDAYLKYSGRLVEAMAKRYGSHPNVVAWQIDNELGGEQKRCYCDNCRSGFQKFLRKKYGSIGELNKRWNTTFWSQHYQKWCQIPVPFSFCSEIPMRHHPSLELEFSRFSSESIIRFSNLQAKLLRRQTKRPITTNTDTFYWGDNVDIFALFMELDIGGMDIYSRIPHEIGFYSDLTRSLKGERFWMMEYGTTSPCLCEEMEIVRSRGCEWFMLFKLLPFPWAQEIDRKALLTITGQPEPNYHKVKGWISEQGEQGLCTPDTDIGLYYNFDSSWAYWIDSRVLTSSIPDQQQYPKFIIDTVYRSFFDRGIPVEILGSPNNLFNYRLLVAARQLIYHPELEEALINYVKGGGHLITTNDLFRRNGDNAWLEYVPQIYEKLFDWHGNNFIEDADLEGEGMVRRCHVGKGQAWMLSSNSKLEDWKAIVEQAS